MNHKTNIKSCHRSDIAIKANPWILYCLVKDILNLFVFHLFLWETFQKSFAVLEMIQRFWQLIIGFGRESDEILLKLWSMYHKYKALLKSGSRKAKPTYLQL